MQCGQVVYIYIDQTLITLGWRPHVILYQGIGRTPPALLEWYILVRGVKFCWYDTMVLSPLK